MHVKNEYKTIDFFEHTVLAINNKLMLNNLTHTKCDDWLNVSPQNKTFDKNFHFLNLFNVQKYSI